MAHQSGSVEQERSTSAILRDIIHDVETIIRAEVKLAKSELREKAHTAGEAAGWLAAAGGAALFAAACFVVTIIAALVAVVPLWLAALIAAVLLSAAAGALFFAGREHFKRARPLLPKTAESIRENAEWLKRQAS
jgi:Flp pilus assembly protein TadB